jgi:enoyl-CoA hydratase/carnithine racemase
MDIKVSRSADFLIVEFSSEFSLMEANAEPLRKTLWDLVEEADTANVTAVMVKQTSAVSDLSKSWLVELQDSALLVLLTQRLQNLSELLRRIRECQVPWIYSSSSSVWGSYLELALACNKRLWFAPYARLGLPDLDFGVPPPCGEFERLTRKSSGFDKFWKSSSSHSAMEAYNHGIIDFVSTANDWLELSEEIAKGMAHGKPQLYFPANKKDAQPGKQKVNPTLQAARSFLSLSYQRWMSDRILRSSQVLHTLGRSTVPQVVIDLDYLAPPTDSLKRLLDAQTNIVFVSADSKSLCQSLDLVYSRLERLVGSQKANNYWNEFVSWYQGAPIEKYDICLRWSVDDQLWFTHNEKQSSFVRLEGNGRDAAGGLLEWSGDLEHSETQSPDPCILGLANYLSDGFVKSKPVGKERVPLSVFLRSLFFEELLRIAPYKDGDFGALIEALSKRGWGFAGHEENWDRFLTTRQDAYSYGDPETMFGAMTMSKVLWELGSWKHAKAKAKRQGANKSEYWNSTAINVHMAIYLGIIAMHIWQEGLVKTIEDSDLLCSSALGFPVHYGTPLGYIFGRSQRRLLHYSQSKWPELNLDLLKGACESISQRAST